MQQSNALLNERRNSRQLLGIDLIAGALNYGQELFRQFRCGHSADMLGVEPDRFGIERIGFREIDHGVTAIDALK